MCTDLLQSTYVKRLPRIQELIHHEIRVGKDRFERRHNALCWSWLLWPTIAKRFSIDDELALDRAADDCARAAVRNRRKLVGALPRESGNHADALNRRADGINLDAIPFASDDDCDRPSWTIGQIPADLRPTALLLLNGLSQGSIAKRTRVSTKTVYRRTNAIADWITKQAKTVE